MRTRTDGVFCESSHWNWDENSINEKLKNTSQGVNFDPLSSREPSSHDDSPPLRPVRFLRDIYDLCMFALITT